MIARFIVYGLVLVVGCFVLFPVFYLFDYMTSRKVVSSATVVDRAHRPAATGFGNTMDRNGNVGFVVTSTSEAWTVIVKSDNMVISADASPTTWASVKPGDPARLTQWVGWLGAHSSVVDLPASR